MHTLLKYIITPPIADAALASRLVWLYIAAQGEEEYASRELAHTLHLEPKTVQLALKYLRAQGLIEVVLEGSGQRASRLRAIYPPLE